MVEISKIIDINDSECLEDSFSCKCYKIKLTKKTENEVKEHEYFANIFFPMKDAYNNSKANDWAENLFGSERNIDKNYSEMWNFYCLNNATKRVTGVDDRNDDYEQRFDFTRSPLVSITNHEGIRVGLGWAERPVSIGRRTCKQSFHISVAESEEGNYVGKALEYLVRNHAIKEHVDFIECGWHPRYKRAGSFFKKLGYDVNLNTGKAIIENKKNL